ncbi:MAG: bifunctional demethylmenaquinone methyltransferase/2-methoxy-6-polyprenyl-1,4-benzoquinol methylase UbiE [Bacteroidia bacterium]|nr:bifunctional demethylmenaquinone methyltransferase/2-methoxy-6-polyprenyl-1,4-benzoquinol methylase UbiE [Bacteroidia bacterium]MCF8447453.1 bifunctional demethylmenaquinone methyltransferase/2-methoxy-6-polyprenyl-1,4-benzoquinol methylase UbiE [Bacteroidia bacterium]
MKEVKPDISLQTSKKEQVEEMFNSIAHRYDFLNRFLSMGIDKGWRKKAISYLKPLEPKQILDVATGTGDLALEAMKLNPDHITGLDIAEQMLVFGREKIASKGLSDKISMIKGDSENLPFPNNNFDAITVAFGVRNFQNLLKGLTEMNRVLKPGGRLVVLEFSKPSSFPYKQVYNFYFTYILPVMGNMLSKSKNAYTYLPESVKHFPEGPEFAKFLKEAGYKNIIVKPLTFGTCSLYIADK